MSVVSTVVPVASAGQHRGARWRTVFSRLGLTPNALTSDRLRHRHRRCLAGRDPVWLRPALIVAFGAAFDMFDGALARATGKSSTFGAFLDSTIDRAGEARRLRRHRCCGMRVALGSGLGGLLRRPRMAAASMVSYARAKSESLGFGSGPAWPSVGLAPREVRSVILVVTLIIAGIAGGISDVPLVAGFNAWDLSAGRLWLASGLALITVLAIITTIQRILFVYTQSKSPNQEVNE